ncbi:MAG: multidrug efflux SMR transporter [Bacteroidales bacterium]|nr:multidrug efflux SMR transporter [Bacteroidales bacterium]
MNWIYLIIAGIFEIGWPLGFKLSQTTSHKYWWICFSVFSMALSGLFLWIAQKEIPIGTAYVVWTGIGALGTLILGIAIFHDPVNLLRLASALLIVMGIVGLRLSYQGL